MKEHQFDPKEFFDEMLVNKVRNLLPWEELRVTKNIEKTENGISTKTRCRVVENESKYEQFLNKFNMYHTV